MFLNSPTFFPHLVINLQVLLCGDQVQFFEATLAPGGAVMSSINKMNSSTAGACAAGAGAGGANNNDMPNSGSGGGINRVEASAKAWLASESDFLCLDFTADLTVDTAAQRDGTCCNCLWLF